MIGKPLYVLTSGSSASAAEEFAGHVAGYKLGELVGETTAGAGFRNDLVPIAGQFVLSVSVGRACWLRPGKDWEAVGHAPSMKVPVSNALETGTEPRLRRLAAGAGAGAAADAGARGRLCRRRPNGGPAALPLTAYAGTYGERTVSLTATGSTISAAAACGSG
jgi:C-terminal processing protease CtpA/Prc